MFKSPSVKKNIGMQAGNTAYIVYQIDIFFPEDQKSQNFPWKMFIIAYLKFRQNFPLNLWIMGLARNFTRGGSKVNFASVAKRRRFLAFYAIFTVFFPIFSFFSKEIKFFSNEIQISSNEIKIFPMKSKSPSPTEESCIHHCSLSNIIILKHWL